MYIQFILNIYYYTNISTIVLLFKAQSDKE